MQSRVLRRVLTSAYCPVLGGQKSKKPVSLRTFRPQGVVHSDHDVGLLTINDGCAGQVISDQLLSPTNDLAQQKMGKVMLSRSALYPSVRHCPRVVSHPAQMEYANGVLVY